MAQLEGKEVGELATERLKQIIIEDSVLDSSHIGELISKGWRGSRKDVKYYQVKAAGR